MNDQSKADIWHRDFCPWMRNRVLGWTLGYLMLSFLLSFSVIDLYFAFSTDMLRRTSAQLGLAPFVLFSFALVAILVLLSSIFVAFMLPKLRSFEPFGWIFVWTTLPGIRLSSQLVKQPRPDEIGFNSFWWIQTSLSMLMAMALICLASLMITNMVKKRPIDYWPWSKVTR